MKKLLMGVVLLSSIASLDGAADTHQGKKLTLRKDIEANDENTYLLKVTATYATALPEMVEYYRQVSAKNPETDIFLDKFRTFKNRWGETLSNLEELQISSWVRQAGVQFRGYRALEALNDNDAEPVVNVKNTQNGISISITQK